MAISGPNLLVSNFFDGLSVFNVANPSVPTLAGNLPRGASTYNEIAILGTFA
jgi:hypothetical protein